MPLAEKGVRGKGRQPLSPPQHAETRSAISAPLSREDTIQSREDARPVSRKSVHDLNAICRLPAPHLHGEKPVLAVAARELHFPLHVVRFLFGD